MKLTPNYYSELLSQIFNNEKPLAKLFISEHGYHLYDTGTNKILGCSKDIYLLLDNLIKKETKKAIEDFISIFGYNRYIEAAGEIIDSIKSENILQLKRVTDFRLSDHFGNFRTILSNSIQSINLELTRDCVLKCLYCIYNNHVKRNKNFSDEWMSIETARKAIEFLYNHSSLTEPVLIGFYGGEPLMNFPLIEECVTYSKQLFKKKEVRFNMTTNAVLITPAIARFLIENEFSIMVSLDGPQEFHDMYRKDKKGNGSYTITVEGIRLLADEQKKKKKGQITVNIVFTPPFSTSKIEKLNEFFKEFEWLPGINSFIQYPGKGTIPIDMALLNQGKHDYVDLMQWAFDKYKIELQNSSPLVKGIIEKRFASFIQRPILNKVVDNCSLNACCIPGKRKCLVSVEGNIHICEKISTNCPIIGNVFTDFDYETIQKVYINQYAENSIMNCSRCWAVNLCDVCYISAFNDNGIFDIEEKKENCNEMCLGTEHILGKFTTLLEEKPDGIAYLYDFQIK